MKKEYLNPAKEIAKTVDYELINSALSQTELKDFELNKQTIYNIAEWCLNNDDDIQIRQKLSLNKRQWEILTALCPALLVVMKQSRVLADIVIAGSIFETAIGGKKIKKQQPVKVKEYNEYGRVIGEHYETFEYEEELPPNPLLLKYLGEHKLSEKLGETPKVSESNYRIMVDSMSQDEKNLINAMRKVHENNDN